MIMQGSKYEVRSEMDPGVRGFKLRTTHSEPFICRLRKGKRDESQSFWIAAEWRI